MRRRHVHCLGPVVLDRTLSVDRIPGRDEKAFVRQRREAAGGPPRNVAAALAAWGEAVSIASVVGGDETGQHLLASLAEAGIGTAAIDIQPDRATATALVIVETGGERAILIEPVPETALAAIGAELEPQAGDLVLANLFHPRAAAVLARARATGALALLDLEWPEIERWGWDTAFAAARAADLVATNGQVAAAFAAEHGLAENTAAAALARAIEPAPGGRVCVTLGRRGVLARDGARLMRAAALPVTPRDTTGAGDRFLAGLARALAERRAFEPALALAIAAAGLFLEGRGERWPEVEAAAPRVTIETLETMP